MKWNKYFLMRYPNLQGRSHNNGIQQRIIRMVEGEKNPIAPHKCKRIVFYFKKN